MVKWASRVGLCAAAWLALAGLSMGGPFDVNSVGATRTIRCDGRSIDVNGSGNNLTLLGDCPDVEINGTSQRVEIEVAGVIRVNGIGNTVIWDRTRDGGRPRIHKAGVNNTVRQGSVGGGEGAEGGISQIDEGGHQEATVGSIHAETSSSGGGETVTSGGGETITIDDNNLTETIECGGSDVRVNGNANVLKLRGECGRVVVSGNRNMLRIEAARVISALGNENDVVWVDGVGGHDPSVSSLGTNNSISRAEP